MYKILVIEDDLKLQDIIKENLLKFGYEVFCVTDFKTVEEQFLRVNPQLVLLDVNLPYYDGFYFCRIFRRKTKAPIIFISARNEDTNQIMGMEMGADDYITKPFGIEVLTSKVNAAIRRCYGEYHANESDVIDINGLKLNENNFKITYFEETSELSKNEYKILKMLLLNADKIVPREKLLEEIWDNSNFVDDNTLTVNITRIKAKLSDLGISDVIKTKRGAGYIFNTSEIKGVSV